MRLKSLNLLLRSEFQIQFPLWPRLWINGGLTTISWSSWRGKQQCEGLKCLNLSQWHIQTINIRPNNKFYTMRQLVSCLEPSSIYYKTSETTKRLNTDSTPRDRYSVSPQRGHRSIPPSWCLHGLTKGNLRVKVSIRPGVFLQVVLPQTVVWQNVLVTRSSTGRGGGVGSVRQRVELIQLIQRLENTGEAADTDAPRRKPVS